MSTIKTTFASGAGGDQDIRIMNLSARMLSHREGMAGFGLSPGLLIILPQEGSHIFQIGSAIVDVDLNDGLIVGGQSRARLTTTYTDGDVNLKILEIGAVINQASRLMDLLQLPCLIDSETHHTLTNLHEALIKADNSTSESGGDNGELTKHLIGGQIVNTLLSLSRSSGRTEPAPQKSSSQLTRLKRFLLSNMHRKITTTDMAGVVGLTREHFCVWAKSQLGKPPARFLRELRMERSLDKLLNTSDSIESISEQIGYADRYHFGKEFKKHFGTSPALFRKERSKEDANYVSRAGTLLKLFRYSDALKVCEQGLQTTDLTLEDQNQLKLLCGHSCKGLEDYSGAMKVLAELRDTNLGWQAGLLQCQLAFEHDHIERALEEMTYLWSLEEADYDELIQVWIQHVTILTTRRCSRDLRGYLSFRKAHFIDNETSEVTALKALRGIGSDLEILEQCPSSRFPCFLALRRCALYDRAIKEYGEDVGASGVARIYLEVGDYERVLNSKPLDPLYCAHAMVDMGIPGDAIRAFPKHSGRAYLRLKKYSELLDAIPDLTGETVYAHIALGRIDELRETLIKGSYFYEWSKCYTDPEGLLREKLPDANGLNSVAQMLTVLKWLNQNRQKDAISLLNEMDDVHSPKLWPWFQAGGIFVLVSIIKALLKLDVDLDADLELTCRNHRYLNRQMTYYDAAYLRGDIDADTYQNQPRKEGLINRWFFVRPLACDLNGDKKEARSGYKKLLAKIPDYELNYLVNRRFAEWRLRELQH